MSDGAERRKRILYGRRGGHKLRAARQQLVDQLLPHISVELPQGGPNDGASDGAFLDLPELFAGMPEGQAAELWLEIGFGAGEYLAAQAQGHPDVAMIGCEPFLNGIASLLRYIERDGLQNIRIWPDDARDLIAALPEASVARSFLLYPDPWPKPRHAKRRFVTAENLDQVARVLIDGGEFLVATDHPVYCRWTLANTLRHDDFEWPASAASDWNKPPVDWPGTRYEAKAIRQGRMPTYLRFVRKPRSK
jgi:tRNA (guanine-N7-)-methyltransferase